MSMTVSHITFTKARPEVALTAPSRIRIKVGEDVAFILDLADAKNLAVDIDSAIVQSMLRRTPIESLQNGESPLAT